MTLRAQGLEELLSEAEIYQKVVYLVGIWLEALLYGPYHLHEQLCSHWHLGRRLTCTPRLLPLLVHCRHYDIRTEGWSAAFSIQSVLWRECADISDYFLS
jgi:hypothetical protein